MSELRAEQRCSYCGQATGAWPKDQPVKSCSCCQQPLIALGPRLQRLMGTETLSVLALSTWVAAGSGAIALALYASGAVRAGEQVVAYALFATAAIWFWQGLANLRSGVSRIFGDVYRSGPDALIAPSIYIIMAGFMAFSATLLDRTPTEVPGAASTSRQQSLPTSRG